MAVADWAFSRWFAPDHITWHDAIRDGLRFAIIGYVVLMVGAVLLQAAGIQPWEDD
jgi:hypothetical protein